MRAKAKAFCWQEKAVLRQIREAFDLTHNVSSALATYVALTEIASDKQSDSFTTTEAWIARQSGLSVRTVSDRIKVFVEMGILGVVVPKLLGPATYSLSPVRQPLPNDKQPLPNVRQPPETSLVADIRRIPEESDEQSSEESLVTEIYLAYPKKVSKPEALRAIRKALKKIDGPKLLETTKAYAVATTGKERQFIPNPATWFNGERFNDDPADWTNGKTVTVPDYNSDTW
jgi:hypothetical protein